LDFSVENQTNKNNNTKKGYTICQQMLALRKSVNCAGKWTASDVSKPQKGQKIKIKKEYPIQKSCKCPGLKSRMFHIQLHKRQLKGSYNLKRLKPPLTRSELITFPTAFRSKSPTPLLQLLYSHANPFKCPNLNLLAARDSC